MYIDKINYGLENNLRVLITMACALILICILTTSISAGGEIDAGFAGSVSRTGGNVRKTVIQPDGKILVGGTFRSINGVAREGLARLNADGSLDTSFNPPEFYSGFGIGGDIYAIKLLSDGKIIVAGGFLGAGTISRPKIAKLNSDGSFDNSFNVPGNLFPFASTVYDMDVYSDSRILVGGSIDNVNGFFYRLNSNGTQDTSFNPPGRGSVIDFVLLPDEKIYASGGSGPGQPPYFVRMNQDGSTDTAFASVSLNGFSVNVISVQTDGKVLVGGNYTFSQNGAGYFARFNANGTLDTSFIPGGPNAPVYAITSLDNGKIVIGGDFTIYLGTPRQKIALINSDGTIDSSFTSPINPNSLAVGSITLQGADKILVGGLAFDTAAIQQPLFRINLDGTIDNSFLTSTAKEGVVYRVAIQPDGKILVGGKFTRAGTLLRNALARFNADGSADASFNPSPAFTVNDEIRGLTLQADGKILVTGSAVRNAARLNPDGTQDISFPNTFFARDIKALSNGKILVAGNSYVRQYNPNGTQDTAFNVSIPSGIVNRILVQPDGKILIAGDFVTVNGFPRGRVARLHSDGSLDTSFLTSTGADKFVHEIALQADGKVLIGGEFENYNSTRILFLARLTQEGVLDTSFNPTFVGYGSYVYAIKVQSNGKILAGVNYASFTAITGTSQGIRRYNPNGSLDPTFSVVNGTNGSVYSLELQSDGKIVAGGDFTKYKGTSVPGIMRLLDSNLPPKTLFDFDGDLKADVSVFRPSTNDWYILQSSNLQFTQQSFGASGDIATPADFDGDGKTDLAIFRPSTGTWWYKSSIDSIFRATQWGAGGDIPLPSDFDGDGRADFIVYRPTNNTLYRLGSNGQSNVTFGVSGDLPLTGDFDGDGKSDPAIFRPSTGDWWYQSSVDNSQRAVHWGVSTDKVAPGDYDGDGKTDFAVFRPSTGVWYILNSVSYTVSIVQFGVSTDKPVAADYDGDGRADIAVFRPSTGEWYLLRSTSGFTGLTFGVSTDIPTPNAFVP